jgi:hypothetical protein
MVGMPAYNSGNDKKYLMSREKRLSETSLESSILDLRNETIWSDFLGRWWSPRERISTAEKPVIT